MADIDLDFLARQMERLLTEMQGMREEMGSIYAELNSMPPKWPTCVTTCAACATRYARSPPRCCGWMAPCSPWRRSLARYLDCSASNDCRQHEGTSRIEDRLADRFF